MLTGKAETPRVMDISTSNKRPPVRIENATQSGLKQPCFEDEFIQSHHTEYYIQKNTLNSLTLLWSRGLKLGSILQTQ
jgi:hypothetical protein